MDMTKDIIDFKQKLERSSEEDDINLGAEAEEECLTETPTPTPTLTPTTTPTPMASASPAATAAATDFGASPQQLSASPNALREREASTPTGSNKPGSEKGGHLALTGDLTPPPRPFTSSEVVGLPDDDHDIRLNALTMSKSRSLPASPNHHLVQHIDTLFGKGTPDMPVEISKSHKASDIKSRPIPSPKGHNPLDAGNQQFCLRWNNYQTNLTNVFDELLQNESFVDVTLACEGQSIKAHKMVLSACSPYFQALFYDNPCQHPIIIMRDVRWQELKAIMEFMYKGEINVSQDQINPLLKVAEMLKIRGLAEVGSRAHGMAAHQMVPEQRMTVYDDEDVENPHMRQHVEETADDAGHKPKRARLLDAALQKLPTALDLNLSAQRQRKRSRDGLLIDDTLERFHSRSRSQTPTPAAHAAAVNNHDDAIAPTPPPIAMTTSTIVRNPFASPNPTILSSGSATLTATATATSNAAAATAATANSAAGSGAAYRPSASCSPPSAAAHSASNGPLAASPPGSSGSNSGHQLPAHAHSATAAAAAAAAAALANTHHPHHAHHHHHAAAAAQQLAAQHQLHAAAHSHAAMASALGASLAAAAVGAGAGGAGGPGGAGTGSGPNALAAAHHDDLEIKPEIAEMIREEERAKMIEGGHPWMGGATTSSVADSYQYQLQSMWQKCWNTNQQNLVQQLRFRERGPLKSWRPEAMAEAIFSVLKEGLSLSQAARKYDIPYPTFVLYANRVHNMLGPSLDGGTDPRPKARGRPQRILLGMWPEELIRSVIKAVVFRDYREIKEDMGHNYANGQPHASPFGAAGNAAAANGYHNAAKLAAQNAALAPPDSPSPLSTMTETLRRQIMSQQQQSPISQTMNMYKSPAYLQRSEIEDQVSAAAAAAAKQQAERRSADNLPDLSALGLMGIPGLNVMPTQSQRSAQLHPREQREREREHQHREREHRERERQRERELKEAMQARQYGNQSRGSATGSDNATGAQKSSGHGGLSGLGPASPYREHHYKNKEHSNYNYNKRFLESLPPGIDFEAIANGLLQKSVNKSPRFEDFFPGQDMSELFASTEAAAAGSTYPAAAASRESSLMKIKLEHQAAEVPHED